MRDDRERERDDRVSGACPPTRSRPRSSLPATAHRRCRQVRAEYRHHVRDAARTKKPKGNRVDTLSSSNCTRVHTEHVAPAAQGLPRGLPRCDLHGIAHRVAWEARTSSRSFALSRSVLKRSHPSSAASSRQEQGAARSSEVESPIGASPTSRHRLCRESAIRLRSTIRLSESQASTRALSRSCMRTTCHRRSGGTVDTRSKTSLSGAWPLMRNRPR